MRRFIFLILLSPTICFAEDVVTYSGSTYTGCQNIGDTRIFLNNPNDYSTVKPGYIFLPNGCGSLPKVQDKYKKISNGQVVEMTQAEKDNVDVAEIKAHQDAEKSAIDKLNVTIEDGFIALVKRINERLVTNKITKQEIVDQIKCDKGYKTALCP